MITWLLWPEILLLVGFGALSWWRPAFAKTYWNGLETRVRRITPGAAFVISFLAPLVVRAALLPVAGIPSPTAMDEFSYVLGGETFALGRVANPPPPVPEAFRALYVLTTPAYVSIYPPAQAAVLAFGQVVFGHPWWGVFLSVGLMAATAWWMTRAFASDGWALLIALLAGLQLGVFTYWMNSYWGGSVAAIGGNLVVGAYGRLRTRLDVKAAWAFTGGAVLLGLRRPYEGLFLVAAIAILLAHDVAARSPKVEWRELTRLLGPLAAGVVGFALFTAWYDLRSTGDWRTMPYVVGDRDASAAPRFVFGEPRTMPELPENIARFEVSYHMPTYWRTRTLSGYLSLKGEQFLRAFWIFLRPALWPPFLAGLAGIWFARRWKLGIALAICLASLLLEVPAHPHYMAPFVPLYCLLLLFGFRALRHWKPRGRPFGLAFSRSLVLVFGLAMLLSAASLVKGTTRWENDTEYACCGLSVPHPRDRIEAFLDSRPTDSLVLIRYGPYNPVHYEYVYNSADPAQAKIVWARDLGPAATVQLVRAFPGREVWRLDVGLLPGDLALTPCGAGPVVPRASPLSLPGAR